MSSLKRHDGVLIIDHRASPGLPAGVARAAGYDPKDCGEGGYYEVAFVICCSLPNAFVVQTRIYCRGCDRYMCEPCYAQTFLPGYKHTPFEKIVDALLSGKTTSLILPPPFTRGHNSG